MILVSLLVCATGLSLSVWAALRTPDWDLPRAFPDAPERWEGITGGRAPLRSGIGTLLFWALAAAGAGSISALVLCLLPPAAAVPSGIVAGLLMAVGVAR